MFAPYGRHLASGIIYGRRQDDRSLLQAEVVQLDGDYLIAQEAQELLLLFQICMFAVRSENVMPMFELIDHCGQLSF
jgi:hypothetical protein